MKSSIWLKIVIGTTIGGLCLVAFLNYYIDPCFHYRYPREGISYMINNERYQNDGMLRHFPYDALITGTSMVENFKPTECNNVFGVDSIKTPYSGGSYKEVDRAVRTAAEKNDSLKMVIRSLDLSVIATAQGADDMKYSSYPEYLYDEDVLNDIYYLLNLDVTVTMTAPAVLFTLTGRPSTSLDEYVNWNNQFTYGKERVLASYDRPEDVDDPAVLLEEERTRIRDNVRINVAETVKNNPDIEFYYFITPYSIVYWDEIVRKGELYKNLEAQKILIEELLAYENLHLFSWCDQADLVCNLDHYKDAGHYGGWINSQMLHWMREGEGLLTEENYKDYLKNIEELYENFDYNSLFK